jgi:hypothetical protein
MRARDWLWILAPAALLAQPTVAPSPEAGTRRGEDAFGYNFVNSWEIGYRARQLAGEESKYRSDVNFGNGVRLLAAQAGIYSRDGRGKYFDQLVFSTQGLGNDPYQSATLRLEKNRLYRYELGWRQNEYFNPGLVSGRGRQGLDTRRRWQDHDLVLLPESRLRLLAGYSRNSQDGPALATFNIDGALGDEFPVFADIRRKQNEYRLGGVAELRGWRLTLVRSWENFKEDTRHGRTTPSEGDNPADRIRLFNLRRDEPYHGTTRSWRLHLASGERRSYALNGRFTYAGGRRAFVSDEVFTGTNRLGAERNRQLVVFGAGRRPVATGNLTLTLMPTSRLTVGNHTALYHVRMEGDAALTEFNNAVRLPAFVYFEALGIRTLANTTDINYRPSARVGLYGGYQFSTRRIRSRERLDVEGFEEIVPAEQTSTIHAGLLGLRLKPGGPLTLSFTGELGRADRPIYPTSERRYEAFGARAEYRTKTLRLAASAASRWNTNSTALSAHSARGRHYTADAAWTPSARLAVEAGYAKLHLDTASALAYFAAARLITGEQSIYRSNLHTGYAGLRLSLRNRLDIYLGYHRLQDAGDGRAAASQPPAGRAIGSAQAAFRAVQTFPVTYQSPLGRLSVRIRDKLRWNAGYQWYGYAEEFATFQNYRAHTGYTSLSWSF